MMFEHLGRPRRELRVPAEEILGQPQVRLRVAGGIFGGQALHQRPVRASLPCRAAANPSPYRVGGVTSFSAANR